MNEYPSDPDSSAELARLLEQDAFMRQVLKCRVRSGEETRFHDILDLACGPAAWGLDTAAQQPEVRLVGIDKSETMIAHARAMARARQLENTLFIVGDILQPLPFDDASFDLVLGRLIDTVVPHDAWPSVLSEVRRVLRKCGVVAMQQFDAPSGTSVALTRLILWLRVALQKRAILIGPQHMQELIQAHFQHVQSRVCLIEWGVGEPFHEQVSQDMLFWFKLVRPFLELAGVTTYDELEHAYEALPAELNASTFRGSWHLWTIWGEK
jgi:ubiquinone/menaquinone biosynthesis C-methylase UbiE